jgi:hypothetical protein
VKDADEKDAGEEVDMRDRKELRYRERERKDEEIFKRAGREKRFKKLRKED